MSEQQMKISEKNLNEELLRSDFNCQQIFYGYMYLEWNKKHRQRGNIYYTLSLYSNDKKDNTICKLWLTESVYFSVPKEIKQDKELFCNVVFFGSIKHFQDGARAYISNPEYIKLYNSDKAKLTLLLSKLCDLEDEGLCTMFADSTEEKKERCCSPLKCPAMIYETDFLMKQSEKYKEILTIESEDLQLSELYKLLDKYWDLMW